MRTLATKQLVSMNVCGMGYVIMSVCGMWYRMMDGREEDDLEVSI